MRRRGSLPAGYFEEIFAGDPDPWGFLSSPYEAEKRADAIEALGGRRYRAGLEVGCANGMLTERLAAQVDDLLAIDVSDAALRLAASRCMGSGARFARRAFPNDAPGGPFDLVLLSEVVYYLDDADILAAGRWLDAALAPSGDVLLVHWTGDTDYPQSGDEAVEKLAAAVARPFETLRADRREGYRLDLWRRP